MSREELIKQVIWSPPNGQPVPRRIDQALEWYDNECFMTFLAGFLSIGILICALLLAWFTR